MCVEEKRLERRVRRASQTTAYMLFVVHFWLGTRYQLLFQFSSTDASFSSQDTEHQWPPKTRQNIQHQILGLFTHLSIYHLPVYHLPTISLYQLSMSLCILNLSITYLYQLSIICLLTISMLSMCPSVYLGIYRLSSNGLHLLSMCLSTYVPRYLSPVYLASVLKLFILFQCKIYFLKYFLYKCCNYYYRDSTKIHLSFSPFIAPGYSSQQDYFSSLMYRSEKSHGFSAHSEVTDRPWVILKYKVSPSKSQPSPVKACSNFSVFLVKKTKQTNQKDFRFIQSILLTGVQRVPCKFPTSGNVFRGHHPVRYRKWTCKNGRAQLIDSVCYFSWSNHELSL